jgi:threonine dehydrogenase-like Zn-dependent dehydrogenase
MKCIKFAGNRKIELVDIPTPKLDEGEILVRIKASAICGSEMESFPKETGLKGNPGHEVMGVVEDSNGSIKYKKGDRVGIANIQGCGHCYWCRQGKQIYCREAQGISNGHAQFVKSKELWLHAIPDDISDEVAVMLTADGFGVPYGSTTKCNIKAGDVCCVYGVGPVGQGMVLYQSFLGAKVIAVDINSEALKKAKSLGAWKTINSKEVKNVNKTIFDLTDGIGPRASFDCCGVQSVFDGAMETTMPGGIVLTVAHGNHGIKSVRESLSFHIGDNGELWGRNLSVCGNWVCFFSDFDDMVSIVRKGFDIDALISKRYSYKDAQEAYLQFEKNRGKTILQW